VDKLTMTTIPRPSIYKVPLYQMAILLLVCVLVAILDVTMAGSALVGGLIQIVPQAWFSRQAFKYSGASKTDLVVRSMYRGEAGKVVMTATLFAIVFALYKQWNYIILFTAFVMMIPLQCFLNRKTLKH
jgi:ATP synthase protein I